MTLRALGLVPWFSGSPLPRAVRSTAGAMRRAGSTSRSAWIRCRPSTAKGARESALSTRAADRVHTYSGSPSDAPAAPSPDRRARREIEVPFTRMGSLMRIYARVNDAATIPFLIDTGASGVSIPVSYAAKIGVRIGPIPRVYRSPPRTASWRAR